MSYFSRIYLLSLHKMQKIGYTRHKQINWFLLSFALSLHITKTNIYNEKFSFYRIHYFTSIRSIL